MHDGCHAGGRGPACRGVLPLVTEMPGRTDRGCAAARGAAGASVAARLRQSPDEEDAMSETQEASSDRLAELVRGIEFAMLTTVDVSGRLRSRPVAVPGEAFQGALWFLVSASALKAE